MKFDINNQINSLVNEIGNRPIEDLIMLAVFIYIGLGFFTDYSKGIFVIFADIIYYTFLSIIAMFIFAYIMTLIGNFITYIFTNYNKNQIIASIFVIILFTSAGFGIYVEASTWTWEMVKIETINMLQIVYKIGQKVVPIW
ncbi:MAG: hypothetical protein ACLFUH_01130 [Bacteroidales bacterium]